MKLMKSEYRRKRVKGMNCKSVHDGMSTSGLSILARIIARHHLLQLRAEHTVPPSVPSGQADGQADGQAGGHTTEEECNESADTDMDPEV